LACNSCGVEDTASPQKPLAPPILIVLLICVLPAFQKKTRASGGAKSNGTSQRHIQLKLSKCHFGASADHQTLKSGVFATDIDKAKGNSRRLLLQGF
jgi:hypothetical protein